MASVASVAGRRRAGATRRRALDVDVVGDGAKACCLYLASDAVAQWFQGKEDAGEQVDFRRLCRYGSFGFLDGCASHVWFVKLDEITDSTALKVCADLALFTPVWCAGFLSFMALTSAGAPRVSAADWRDLYLGNVAAWLPANVAIYGAVPLEHRVLSFGLYNLLYTAALSFWRETTKNRREL